MHSVVVPVFNEAESVDAFHARCTAALADLQGDDYEIVFVDDGSRDATWDLLQRIAQDDSHVRLVRLSRNFGQPIATTAGYDFSRGDTVTTIDGDLQDPPELIVEMVRRWREGAEIVYAARRKRDGETAFKKASSVAYTRLLRRMTDVDIPVDVGDFRLLSRKAVDALGQMPEQSRYLRGMVAWLGFRSEIVGFDREPRLTGTTKYPLGKMMKLAADGVLSFSVRPLRIATWLGVVTSAAAFIGVATIIVFRFTGIITTVRGWSSIVVLVLMLFGIQLLTIGALGEYMGRIYTEVRRRPLYLVAETSERVPSASGRLA
ncbi:MAG: glycosyltransferase family 2 protein [Coriobacteriia bacterium]|nr:glycosyltransferase family 2 protein [Coriobacteriia bacterium]